MKKLLFLSAVVTIAMFSTSCGKTESKETELSKSEKTDGGITPSGVETKKGSDYDTTIWNSLVVIKDNKPILKAGGTIGATYNPDGLSDEQVKVYGRNFASKNTFDEKKYVYVVNLPEFKSKDVIIVVKKYAKISPENKYSKLQKAESESFHLFYPIVKYYTDFNQYFLAPDCEGSELILNGKVCYITEHYKMMNIDVFFDVYYYNKATDKIDISFKNSHFEVKSNDPNERYKTQSTQFCTNYEGYNKPTNKIEKDYNRVLISTPLNNPDGTLIRMVGPIGNVSSYLKGYFDLTATLSYY